ncbi:RNA methyltransferase [Verrucomicrobiales bacterium BCK34]|nr:RNA methyltransferase [Verrucomicrobiales bacterium BCK34]
MEGRLAVEALIDSVYFQTESLFVEEGRHESLLARAKEKGLDCQLLSREKIAEEAGFPFHRGVFATAKRPGPVAPTGEAWSSFSRILVPVNLADGGNLGTLIRTAVAFGCDAVLLESGKGTDVYSRKCIRASATAIFRVPVFFVESLQDTLEQLKREGVCCYATALEAESVSPREVALTDRSAILFGPEKDGLTSEVLAACDVCISIPMEQGMDSLNVAASGAIVMYEIFGRGSQ